MGDEDDGADDGRPDRTQEHRAGRDVLEGVSARYTAIALIGLAAHGDEEITAAALAGHPPARPCGRMIERLDRCDDIGEVALILWAARTLKDARAEKALRRLRQMDPLAGDWPTVELSWCLTALLLPEPAAGEAVLAEALAGRLLQSFNERSGLFPHRPAGAASGGLRRHVTCFADFVYPTQALSHYYRASGSEAALRAARLCAETACRLQGPRGQWWWHFDCRTGRVVERFPVYAVHQDSMAPMALLACRDAGGGDYTEAIQRGLRWLAEPPEIPGSLIDRRADVIWRKVARYEPGKLVRAVQAASSRLHPALRAPGMDLLFPPGWIDYETRPYHMGWILYAWSQDR